MAYLYRGVNSKMDRKTPDPLAPKGTRSKLAIEISDDSFFSLDGTWVVGESKINTVVAHQAKSGLFDGSGVSTTRSPEVAAYFAGARDKRGNGFVYVLCEEKLKAYGVDMLEPPSPRYPWQKEVTLVLPDGTRLPADVIIDKVEIVNKRPVRQIAMK